MRLRGQVKALQDLVSHEVDKHRRWLLNCGALLALTAAVENSEWDRWCESGEYHAVVDLEDFAGLLAGHDTFVDDDD